MVMEPLRHILHVDMDEFFAAVEKLDRPSFVASPCWLVVPPNNSVASLS